MSVTDNVADFFTRIRNSLIAKHDDLTVNYSNVKLNIAKILLSEGFIKDFSVSGENQFKKIDIKLKYDDNGQPIIQCIDRVSKCGKRIYVKKSQIPKVRNGFGISIISTPKGILSGRDARLANVGGEFLGVVY